MRSETIKLIKLAGLMHDIGYRILNSVNEFSEISMHVLQHHEKWDGSGYPQGLKGGAITIEARIIAIVDAYAAMTNKRSYVAIKCNEDAVCEIKRCAGTQVDHNIVKVFVEYILGN